MIKTEAKNIFYSSLILLFSSFVIMLSIIYTPSYFIFFTLFLIWGFMGSKEIIPKFLLANIYIVIHFVSVLILRNIKFSIHQNLIDCSDLMSGFQILLIILLPVFLFSISEVRNNLENNKKELFLISIISGTIASLMSFNRSTSSYIIHCICTLNLLTIPFYFLYKFFFKVVNTSYKEKENYFLIKSCNNAFCLKHITRIKVSSVFGYRAISCRVGTNCINENQIDFANEIVGIIGDNKLSENTRGKRYYHDLFDIDKEKISNADYDIIEIHGSTKIKDYDAIINKVISYFYNELNRHKPINEVIVKVIGNPDISENTRRLLKEKFLRVEYST